MTATEVIEAIGQLPPLERDTVIDAVLQLRPVPAGERQRRLLAAYRERQRRLTPEVVEAMREDYLTDEELTLPTRLNYDDVIETE